MKSLDSGGTWAPTSFDSDGTFTALADFAQLRRPIGPSPRSTADDRALYLSTDGGATAHCRGLHLGAGDKQTMRSRPPSLMIV